ncbi:CesT family type III secretion system chaperone [Noviherbaspirillum saxi]|uniref:Molecular chaperone Tir n=1 Tax=Noviherbaspirillum saxi TaxID=2320863 RepID=A0A3A3FG03_9BURK|nr:CesT family type III secretion system chaperone [Noviherbaspirillum saxi]RJF92110.1 molecular chaperone Tir [Noviherbaspirillum saxi]
MSAHEYRGLVEGICALTGIADAASMLEMANFEVNGIPFTLMDGSEIEDGTVLYFCDFGEVPGERRADILQELLEANLAMYAKESPSFSINFYTKHVVLTGRIAIRNTTPAKLLEELAWRAHQATQWRQTCLLSSQAPLIQDPLQKKTVNTVKRKSPSAQFRAD